MRVGICGLGTVGGGVFNLLRNNREEIRRKTGRTIELVQIGARRDNPDVDTGPVAVTRDIFEVARNPEVDVVLELIGGTDTALDLVREAISNGKHIVTANKALIAIHGEEIFSLARRAGVQVRFEPAIAGGIPVVKAVREGLAGNRISWIAGIINGTSNFILSGMERPGTNLTFKEMLDEAQRLGYAEVDPTFDVEGIDAAHKLTILASIAFGVPLQFDAMYTEGISRITPEDIHYAGELGYRIRHLGVTRLSGDGVELRVHPALIAREEMLAQVHGVMNAVMIGSDAAGGTLYYGAGAGAGPTASAVVADIVDIMRCPGEDGVPDAGFRSEARTSVSVVPMEDVRCPVYLRLHVLDKPGVMAQLTRILSDQGISIEALIQKDAHGGNAVVVLLTDEVREAAVDNAIGEIESLAEVQGGVTRIRVASLDG